MNRPRLSAFRGTPFVCLVTLALGCSSASAPTAEPSGQNEDDLLRKTGSTSHWSYRGPLPELDNPRITMSIAGHTAHVQGLLPAGWSGVLPFYAVSEPAPSAPGRTLVHVAYPIATVNPNGVTVGGLPTRNPEPFTYAVCGGDNFHASNDLGSFGGFPFIEYVCGHRDHDGRIRSEIAFHGPITDADFDGTPYWSLLRGPVSHACNRMLGEHVLELAHLIGFEHGVLGTPVQVIAGFDTWHGRSLDVDYPATGFTRPSASASIVFPIWQAVKPREDGTIQLEFPQWACETSRCGSLPPNALDPVTGGRPLGEIACPANYHLEAVGTAGGQICVSDTGQDAWGPYTQAMVAACKRAGGGAVCDTNRWAAGFAKALRGNGACPLGAAYDVVTGYCQEGADAFGPFPATLVDRCIAAGGGDGACRSARWNRLFLALLQGRIGAPARAAASPLASAQP